MDPMRGPGPRGIPGMTMGAIAGTMVTRRGSGTESMVPREGNDQLIRVFD